MHSFMSLRQLLLLWALLLIFDTNIADASACRDESDCFHNGDCTDNGKCVCDAAWEGEQCDVLRFDPSSTARRAGYHNASEASWGGNAIFDESTGMYHLFVAQMANGCGLGDYGTNSMIIRAVSKEPSGPFTFEEIVLAPFAHNPTARKLPNNEGIVIYFIGDGNAPRESVKNCTNSKISAPTERVFSTGSIHAIHGPTVFGPWSDPVAISFDDNNSAWGGAVTNPSPHVESDGTVTMALQRAFEANPGKELIGVARANRWTGPFKMITSSPVEPEHWYCVAGTGEDPFLWKTDRGWHMIWHGMCPSGFLESHYASSDDAVVWKVSSHQTYGYRFRFADGTSHFFARVERPQLVFDGKSGKAVALLNGVCDGASLGDIDECLFGQDGMTWTGVRALAT
eukprot:g135.t1